MFVSKRRSRLECEGASKGQTKEAGCEREDEASEGREGRKVQERRECEEQNARSESADVRRASGDISHPSERSTCQILDAQIPHLQP